MCYNSENANLSAIVFDRTDAHNGKRRNHAVGYRNAGKRALKDIREVAAQLSLTEDELELYGKYKAKLSLPKGLPKRRNLS